MRKERCVSENHAWFRFYFCLLKKINSRRLFIKSQGEETDKTLFVTGTLPVVVLKWGIRSK